MENHPAPDQPATEAHAGTPHYGEFGHPVAAAHPAAAVPTARRVYVGGYVDPAGEHGGCPAPETDPTQQRGHADQNQDTAAIMAAHGKDEAVERAAFALDDPRYAGGDVYDLDDEQTSL